jgi:hypothetical protein
MKAGRPVSEVFAGLGRRFRSGIVVLCVLSAGLALGSAPAWATAPEVGGESASPVGGHGAKLNAGVIPNWFTITAGASVTYYFEYGTTAAYGSVTPTEGEEELIAYAKPGVSAIISGLEPGTEYHFRVVATNGKGETSDGADTTFSTPPAATAPGADTYNGFAGSGSAELGGYVTPNGFATTYYAEYGKTEAYGSVTPTGELPELAGQTAVHSHASPLKPDTLYHYRVVATNTNGKTSYGVDETFTTLGLVGAESSSNVGSSSVTLNAQVNPPGSLTTYHFEYGTSEAYGSVTLTESAGVGSETVGAQTAVHGLQPGTLYHFRVVVTDAGGETVDGADTTFSTYPTGLTGLPNGRLYERVTPEFPGDLEVMEPDGDEGGAGEDIYYSSGTPVVRAAADGSALAYLGTLSPEGGGELGNRDEEEYLARRAAAGWTNSEITPLHTQETTYQSFTSSLSGGFIGLGATEGSPGGLYFRSFSDLGAGSYHFIAPSGSYVGSTPDGSHLLVESREALTALAKEDPLGGGSYLYDFVNGQPYLVDVLPDGNAVGADLGDGVDLRNAISTDGSRIFWTDVVDHELYVRENDTQPQSPLNGEGRCTVPADACTVEVDASQGGPGSSGGGVYRTAATDGSRVFFTDCNHLTAKFSEEPEGCGSGDLYGYDVENGRLTDLTVDDNASHPDPHGANVQGVLGASEDGSYVYFVATGVLASGAVSGQYNLYALHVGEAIKFVAALNPEVNQMDYGYVGDWKESLGYETAQVSSDGRHLLYVTKEGSEARQLRMYDYGAEAPYCISCSPAGTPESVSYETTTYPVSRNGTFALRVMSGDGDQVFFDSKMALVPQDTNGREDVYEWERDGSGSCQLEEGCLYLLSGGAGEEGSYFLDASENGDDVFMVTTAQLGPQLQNEALHIVDVRVGVQSAASECAGSGCQGVPGAPPIFATPASVTFEGVGNFEPAAKSAPAPKQKGKPKKKRKKRSKVKGKAKKAGARKARRAATRGKAGRS